MKEYPVIGGDVLQNARDGEYIPHDPALDEMYRKFDAKECVVIGKGKFLITSIDVNDNYFTAYYDENGKPVRLPGLRDVTIKLMYFGEVTGGSPYSGG